MLEGSADDQLTVMGMRHQEEAVALQAIEFWSTVCEEEIELAIEAQEVSSHSNPLTAGHELWGKSLGRISWLW
jgi:hypothetical protein